MRWVNVETVGNGYFTIQKRCNLNSVDIHINVNEELMKQNSDYDGWCEYNTMRLKTKYQDLLHTYHTIYRNTFTDWLGLTTFESRYKKLMNDIIDFLNQLRYDITMNDVAIRIICIETTTFEEDIKW